MSRSFKEKLKVKYFLRIKLNMGTKEMDSS